MVRKSRIRRRSANAPPAMKKRPLNMLIIRAVVLVMMILCSCSGFGISLFGIETTFSLESDDHTSDGKNGRCLLVLSDCKIINEFKMNQRAWPCKLR